MAELRPKVGVGVMVIKEGKVLLGKRIGGNGHGKFAGTGGHLEHSESFEACARRETLEEAGIEITNVRFLCLSNFMDPHHYVDIGLIADWHSGELECREPHKCEGWGWYDLDDLPEPLFVPERKYIEAFRSGRYFSDDLI